MARGRPTLDSKLYHGAIIIKQQDAGTKRDTRADGISMGSQSQAHIITVTSLFTKMPKIYTGEKPASSANGAEDWTSSVLPHDALWGPAARC